MPPPASSAALPAYERPLRPLLLHVEPAASVLKSIGQKSLRRSSERRSVPGKDFLQRLREAGL